MTEPDGPARGRRRGTPLSEEDERRRADAGYRGRHIRDEDLVADPFGAGPDGAESDVAPAGEPDGAADGSPASAGPAAPPSAPARPSPERIGPGLFRGELQGLRAVAILMVVCYHIWFGRVSGGVDIFLLISAFLLTGSFVRTLEDGRPLRVPQYWLHAFKRLVPPGALVILATVAASLLILPATRWLDLLTDAVASLTYWENWLLAARSVDYYAADHSTASPLQHYWSLSIQGQVFFLWPLLFLVLGLLIRRLCLPVVRTLLIAFGAITLASLAWSIRLTATDQALAYFQTWTRLWEFSLGSVLALALPWIERRLGYRQTRDPRDGRLRALRGAAAWAGVVLILACGWVVDVQGAFPGWIALWPLLAACLVIAAGPTGTAWGADRLLASRPLQWLGDISYALYLVHWPLLILALVTLEKTRLNAWQGALLVGASIVLAWLLTRFVDTPVRRSAWLEARWWRSALAIAVSCAVVLAAVGVARDRIETHAEEVEAEAPTNNPGARSLRPGYVDRAAPDAPTIPDATRLPGDWFSLGGRCSGRFVPDGDLADMTKICGQKGDGSGPVLVIVGDSRVEQYAPSIVPQALAHGWTVITLLSGGCQFGEGGAITGACAQHDQHVMDYLDRLEPDAIATASTQIGDDRTEVPTPGFAPIVQRYVDRGTSVIGFRAMPRLRHDPASCLDDPSEPSCTEDVASQYAATAPEPALELGREGQGRYIALDLVPDICPDRRCPPVIGNVHVWLDSRHISATYAQTLQPAADQQLNRQGWDWRRA